MAFYAYSPSAAGFYGGSMSRASATDKTSRWNVAAPLGARYVGDFLHDYLFDATHIVRQEAARHVISGHAAALRWTTWHSELGPEYGDSVIVGASHVSRLTENLDILEQGPLLECLVATMDGSWEDIKDSGKSISSAAIFGTS